MYEEHSTRFLSRARFCIDGLEDQFDGFTYAETWNGWACPYFERAEAERVLQASKVNGYEWAYDVERDAYVVRSIHDPQNYEPEEFSGLSLTIEGEIKRLYGIGSFSWTWKMCDG